MIEAVVEARLKENNIPFCKVKLDFNYFIIVSQYGARVYGPYRQANDAGIFWVSDQFSDPAQFSLFINKGEWNSGGDRLWLAPELDFNVTDPSRFFDTYDLPPEIDPGKYQLVQKGNACFLSSDFRFTPRSRKYAWKHVVVNRKIKAAANPLRANPECETLMQGVDYCGYSQEVKITNLGIDHSPVEAWTLLQLPGEGKTVVATQSTPIFAEYYEPANDLHELHKDCAILDTTGKNRFKIGYHANCVAGRVYYLNEKTDRTVLLVREFDNDRSVQYTMQPANQSIEGGNYSIHIYNDDGNFGGFTELEMSGKPIYGNGNSGIDTFRTWIYFGKIEKLNEIAFALSNCSAFEGRQA